jgi:hypothetical protein
MGSAWQTRREVDRFLSGVQLLLATEGISKVAQQTMATPLEHYQVAWRQFAYLTGSSHLASLVKDGPLAPTGFSATFDGETNLAVAAHLFRQYLRPLMCAQDRHLNDSLSHLIDTAGDGADALKVLATEATEAT